MLSQPCPLIAPAHAAEAAGTEGKGESYAWVGPAAPPRLLDAAFQSELEDGRVLWVNEWSEDALKHTHEIKERVKDRVLGSHHALAIRVTDIDRDTEIAAVMGEAKLLCLLLCHESKQFGLH